MLDRIDIQIHVPRLEYNEMRADNRSECSADIRKRVSAARQLQLERLQGTGLHCNAEMSRREIKKKCRMTAETEQLLQRAFVSLGLSARSHDRIIKVAQTIADLEHSDVINTFHLAEAIELRTISKG